ncbi:MAG: fluoride efflux transporter CrcB [Oscillospiraceae bacterium]
MIKLYYIRKKSGEFEMINCLCVGFGGFVGAVLRYLVGLIPFESSNGFPFKTLAVNIAGSFLIGIIAALAGQSIINEKWNLFLKVGICGGFTTFSTFALESDRLFKNGAVGFGILYIVLSVVLSILAVIAAQIIVSK